MTFLGKWPKLKIIMLSERSLNQEKKINGPYVLSYREFRFKNSLSSSPPPLSVCQCYEPKREIVTQEEEFEKEHGERV